MHTYTICALKLEISMAFWLSGADDVLYIIAILLSGAASDVIGRNSTVLINCAFFTLASLTDFISLNNNPTPLNYFLIVNLVGLFSSMYTGPAAAALLEIFPTSSWSSGMAIGYNVSTVVFGGFTPFIVTWLNTTFATPLAPIYYVVVCALASGLFILTLKETARAPLY